MAPCFAYLLFLFHIVELFIFAHLESLGQSGDSNKLLFAAAYHNIIVITPSVVTACVLQYLS